jgi:hypothetical protein
MNPTDHAPVSPARDDDVTRLGAGFDFTDPNSPLAPYYCRTSHIVAAALLGLIFVFFSFVPLWHTDVWGHLKFGQWMVEHRRLPEREPFSRLADRNAPALHAYWFLQVGLYGLYHAGELLAGGDPGHKQEGGVAILRSTLALVLVLRCGVLLTAFRKLGGSLPMACVALIVMLLASVGHITVFRPQAFAELLFAGCLLVLSRPVLSRTGLVVLPLLLVVWANIHGSYPSGLLLLAGCLAGQAATAGWSARTIDPRRLLADPQVRQLLLVLALSVGGIALFNPHGPFIFWETVRMGRHPNVQDMEEWRALSFQRTAALLWLYLFSLGVLAVAPLCSRRWYTPAQILVLVGFGVGPLLHVRMMVWWFMLVPWLFFPQWRAIRERFPAWGPHLATVPSFRKTLLAGFVLAMLVAWSSPAQWLFSGEPTPRGRALFNGTPWQVAEQLRQPGAVVPDGVPGLSEALARHYAGGRFTGGIFASETQGDYLVWALAPQTPVFMYTHVHLMTPEGWQLCRAVKRGSPAWRQILDAYGINLVVAEAEMYPVLCNLLHEDSAWVVLVDETGDPAKRDSRARIVIALRREPGNAE